MLLLAPSFTKEKPIDADSADHKRQDQQHLLRRAGVKDGGDQHRPHHGHRVSLEQVGCHARAVTDIVAHVVGDHRGIAGIVFRDARLDLADEIRADIGALGEDAAAEPRENGNQRRPAISFGLKTSRRIR